METLAAPNPLEYGIMSFALLLVWKMLDVAKTLFLAKKIEQPASHHDPQHFDRIRDIHEYTEEVQKESAAGHFKCQWKDRDEVRDFMEIMRAQTNASKVQTTAINSLTTEMRLTRNGKS